LLVCLFDQPGGCSAVGYTIPEGVDAMLDIVGVGWPNVDEDAYRDMADALREFADDADGDAGVAHGHIQALLSTGGSESLAALDQHWKKVQGRHKDLGKAARTIAGALDRVADIIVARKMAAVAELADLAASVGITLALAPVTGGLSALIGAAKIAATRIAFKRILKEMADAAVAEVVAILTEPAVAALENVAADLAVQTALNVAGVQDGYDTSQTGQAAKEGLRLASTGVAGGGPGAGGGPKIDHAAHERAGVHLNGVQVVMRAKTGPKLGKAKGHHGRAKGRDSLTAVLDATVDGVMHKLTKAFDDLGDHVGKTLPNALSRSSRTHKSTDLDVRDSINKVTADKRKDDKDDSRGRRSSPDGDVRTRPDSVRAAKDDPRAHGVSLDKTVCKNDPVDVASGKMLLPQTDLTLPGVLPLVLRRTHVSTYRYGYWFGRSWASTLDERIEVDPVGGAIWAREDGSLLVYPRLPGHDGEQVLPLEGDRLPLVHGGVHGEETSYEVHDPHSGRVRVFTGSPYRTSTAYWLSDIRDRNGNQLTFSRRSDGAPVSVAHSGGYVVQFTTDASRVMRLAIRGPRGPVTVVGYSYDPSGDLVTLTGPDGPDGPVMAFTYDETGRMTSWTDRNGTTFQYVYDAAGRVTRTVGPDGILSSQFAYDVHPDTGHGITRYTDSTGATTVLVLNDRLQLVAETDPLGHTTSFSWDDYDRPLTRTDPLGHTTALTYDEHGNLVQVRLPDGSTATARYDEHNLPVEVTTTDGAVWRQTFDAQGNCTSTVAADGTVTHFTHDATGAVASVTDALGATIRIRSDRAGLPLEITGPEGGVTRVERDHRGRPVSIIDPAGGREEFDWDDDDHLRCRIATDGTRETWSWDPEGNCQAYTDAVGGVWTTEYGPFDKPLAHIAPDGSRHELRYDTELRLRQVTNPLGQTWLYRYDGAGRLVAETDFDGRSLTYTYDPANRLTTRTTPLGQSVTYTWDALDRLVKRDVDGAVTHYAYDRAGALVEARTATSTLTIHRDALGRPLAETVDGRTLRHSYDAAGRRIARITPTGAVSQLAYSAAGDRVSLTTDGHALAFTHDRLGREVTRTWGVPGTSTALTTDWDRLGRPARQTLSAVGSPDPLSTRSYTYRADGYPTILAEHTSGRTTRDRHITLDPMGRPLAVEGPDWSESYAYDGAGNQVSARWPAAAGHTEARGPRHYEGTRLISAGTVHYEHDDAGRVIVRRRTRLSRKPDTWRYTYDAEDRLLSCTTPDDTLWVYAYDPLGRRSAKHRMAADGTTIVETIRFTWDGPLLVEQHDETAGTILTWEYQGHRPLVQYERRRPMGDAEVDARFFAIVTDLVGTPTELVSPEGTIAWRSRSTCWGSTAWNTSATAYTPLRFPGQYADPETGLHYNYFRHYDPDAARFTSPDPLGLSPAPNPSTYVANPWVWSDPLGLAPKRCQMDAYDWDGSVRYGRLDHLGRPTGVYACLRPEIIDAKLGTEAGKLRPPGWRGDGTAFNEARGHLLADRLGGAGKGRLAWHNLVTQTQTPTNSPDQRDQVEQVIFDQVTKHREVVQYHIKPVYEGANPIPIRLEFTAFGNKGFTFSHSLENPAGYVRTGVPRV
jgi:RHS repeat-associated protein